MKKTLHLKSVAGMLMLLLSGTASFAQFTITYPTASTVWEGGKTYTIQWTSAMGAPAEFLIQYNYKHGTHGQTVVYEDRVPGAAGSYTFIARQPNEEGAYYTICFTDTNEIKYPGGCSPVFTVVSGSGTGMKQLTNLTDVNIFPVPLQKTSVLQLTLTHPVHLQVSMYDILGNEADHLKDEPSASGNITVALPAQLAGGIYFIRILAGDERLIRKVIAR